MSFIVKQSTQLRLPVLLISSIDHLTEKTGSVTPTVYLLKADGTVNLLTVVSWTEVSSSHMPGLYDMVVNAADLAVIGPSVFYVSATGTDIAKREVFISGSIADDIAVNVLQIRRVNEGKLIIDPVANTLTVYGNDGVTVQQSWALKDSGGNPTHTNPFQRFPTVTIP